MKVAWHGNLLYNTHGEHNIIVVAAAIIIL